MASLAYVLEHVLEHLRWADDVATLAGELPGWGFEIRSAALDRPLDSVALRVGPEGVPERIDVPAGPLLLLLAEPKAVFTSIEEARAAFEPMIRAWEAHFELSDRGFPVTFEFAFGILEDASAPDRESSREAQYATVDPGGFIVRKLESSPPPPPPEWFSAVPPVVDELRRSWRRVQAGHALTLDRAYWCLTVLEATYGGRRRAAAALRVDMKILETVGRLCAAEDRLRGRKVGGRGPSSIRHEDEVWLRAAIPRLILRVAEVELVAPGVANLRMADLPQL